MRAIETESPSPCVPTPPDCWLAIRPPTCVSEAEPFPGGGYLLLSSARAGANVDGWVHKISQRR